MHSRPRDPRTMLLDGGDTVAPIVNSLRCMDARTKRPPSAAGRAPAFHRRSRTFRTPNSFGAGKPIVQRDRARRSTCETPVTPLMVVSVYEGLRLGRCGTRTLRRSLLEFPWPRLYEHPWMNCALAIERDLPRGGRGLRRNFPAPERQTLTQLQQAVSWYKNETLEKVGFYRMALAVQQGTDAGPAAALVEHVEPVRVQAVQAVWRPSDSQATEPWGPSRFTPSRR